MLDIASSGRSPDIGSLLKLWQVLEVLSPPETYRDERAFAEKTDGTLLRLGPGPLPWEQGYRGESYGRYQLVIGMLDAAQVDQALAVAYPVTNPNYYPSKGLFPIAVAELNHLGQAVEERAPTLSSFAWGLQFALSKNLAALEAWPHRENEIAVELLHVLSTEEGRKISHAAINRALAKIAVISGLNGGLAQLASFTPVLVGYPFSPRWADKNALPPPQDPPKTLIMNSFYLDDLKAAPAALSVGRAPLLKRFLIGFQNREKSINLTDHRHHVARLLEPGAIHLARWPAGKNRSLVTMQQVAANCVLHHADPAMQGGEKLVAVNGPPGTGKTTLVRDVIAGLVTDRALVMAQYEDPNQAFAEKALSWKTQDFTHHVRAPDEKLRGFEIVVASSNNSAVENITKELPGIGAVGAGMSERYFAGTASMMNNGECWGMIAAALGNAANRSEFAQWLKWHKDWGILQALSVAAGKAPKLVEYTKDDGHPAKRVPLIITSEKPPSTPAEALAQWRVARKLFQKAYSEANTAIKAAQALVEIQRKVAANPSLEAPQTRVKREAENYESAKAASSQAAAALKDEAERVSDAERIVTVIERRRPNWLARLLHRRQYREFQFDIAQSSKDLEAALMRKSRATERLRTAHEQEKRAREALNNAEFELTAAIGHKRSLDNQLSAALAAFDGPFVDRAFLYADHTAFHTASPWLNDHINMRRENLFCAAMAVHRAFIFAAARPFQANLSAIADMLNGKSTPSKDSELNGSLWATLFMLVPVLSTTFASMSRLFSGVDASRFGYLIIDEAGQASPQQAVGGLMRCRNAVIVGDPLQIEPVSSLREEVSRELSCIKGIDPALFVAPMGSVQILADRASAFQGSFRSDVGSRSVGIPLLVHRRCAEPMFSISNSIAYEGAMVSTKAAAFSPIRDLVGDSRWFDVVDHEPMGKWSGLEGEVIVDLMRQILRGGASLDLYVISPFREVAFRASLAIKKFLMEAGETEPAARAFIKARVGTVHRAQGKEAECVIFVLGAQGQAGFGARKWAGVSPNLPNVAVTRAKEVLYVVGNYGDWRNAGHFREIAHRVPPVDVMAPGR